MEEKIQQHLQLENRLIEIIENKLNEFCQKQQGEFIQIKNIYLSPNLEENIQK